MPLTESELASLYRMNQSGLQNPGAPPGTGQPGRIPPPPPPSGGGQGVAPPAQMPGRQPVAQLYAPVSVGQAAPAQLPRQWQSSGLPSYSDRIKAMADRNSAYNMSQMSPGDLTDDGHLVTTSGPMGASVSSTGETGGGPPQNPAITTNGATQVPHSVSSTGWVDAQGNPTPAPEGWDYHSYTGAPLIDPGYTFDFSGLSGMKVGF